MPVRARSRSSMAAIVLRPPRLTSRSSSSSGSTPSRMTPPSRTVAGGRVHEARLDLRGHVERRGQVLDEGADEGSRHSASAASAAGSRPQR